ncbi:MAG: polyprenyl diphosphate synthase [Patescibacteria group bacterium]|nr:polyprenyl diphosphate synthase [Patescibacteria group bacterium]
MSSKNKATPKHIVLFPDGNRRWAKEHKLESLKGHLRGKENFDKFLSLCKDRSVEVVTVFGFSSENWNRSPKEVNYLMDLFEISLNKKAIARFQKEGVKVKVIGQKERLKPSLQKVIEVVEEATAGNDGLHLNLAVSYGGKWDIVQAVQQLIKKGVKAEDITEDMLAEHLSTAGLPEPDLVIRAGGEKRLSNFVLWQAAYAELYFSEKYWPDFGEEDLDLAFEGYARRQRRFGK